MSGDYSGFNQAFNQGFAQAQQQALMRAQMQQQQAYQDAQLELARNQDARAQAEADAVQQDRDLNRQAESIAAGGKGGLLAAETAGPAVNKAMSVASRMGGGKGNVEAISPVATFRARRLLRGERGEEAEISGKEAQTEAFKTQMGWAKDDRSLDKAIREGQLERLQVDTANARDTLKNAKEIERYRASLSRQADAAGFSRQLKLMMVQEGYARGRMKTENEMLMDRDDRQFIQNTVGRFVQSQLDQKNTIAATTAQFALSAYNAAATITPTEMAQLVDYYRQTDPLNAEAKAKAFLGTLRADAADSLGKVLTASQTGDISSMGDLMAKVRSLDGLSTQINDGDVNSAIGALESVFGGGAPASGDRKSLIAEAYGGGGEAPAPVESPTDAFSEAEQKAWQNANMKASKAGDPVSATAIRYEEFNRGKGVKGYYGDLSGVPTKLGDHQFEYKKVGTGKISQLPGIGTAIGAVSDIRGLLGNISADKVFKQTLEKSGYDLWSVLDKANKANSSGGYTVEDFQDDERLPRLMWDAWGGGTLPYDSVEIVRKNSLTKEK